MRATVTPVSNSIGAVVDWIVILNSTSKQSSGIWLNSISVSLNEFDAGSKDSIGFTLMKSDFEQEAYKAIP